MVFPPEWATWNINQRMAFLAYIGAPQLERDAALKEWMSQEYGQLAGYLDHPELGPLLQQAGREGWTRERLQAELGKTTFWHTTTESQRTFDLQTQMDPATAESKIAQMAGNISTILGREGVAGQYTPERIRNLSIDLLRNGVPADQVPQFVLADVTYRPTSPVGTMGQNVARVKQRAAEYVVPLSDEAAFEWGKQLSMGTVTADGVDEYLRQQAKSRFGHLTADIDRGFTTKQLFDPYIQQTAQLLEKSPDEINLLDPTYTKMIDSIDADTNERRAMTLSEAATTVRSMDAYQTTRQATSGAAQLGEAILQTFGEVR